MAFIDNNIIHHTFSAQALEKRNIYNSGGFMLTAANSADLLVIDIKECRETYHPLVQHLLPMEQDERVHCDE